MDSTKIKETEFKEAFDVVRKNRDVALSDEFYERYIENFKPDKRSRLVYRFLKRTFDIIFSLIALIVSSPVFIIVSLAIAIDSKGPVLFRQERIGKGGRVFCCLKFRSMRTDAPDNVASSLMDDPDEYLTKVGRFLRKTSLDELPQLLNILFGSMSFIGYRPLIISEVKCNGMREKLGVFAMRPGLSGLAQVNGRDDVYYKNKAIMDAEYVKNASLWYDIKLFFKTIFVVFSRNGNADGKKRIEAESGE